MEIKSYFLILARRWRIVLPVFAVTLAATILITLNQPSIYSSSTTYVLAPGTGFEDAWSFAAGLDTLSRQREIATTYTEVATSQTVERQAYEQLGLTQEQKRGVKVSCGLLPGTNIMEITAQGPNPGIARDVANAIGEQTLGYANALYESYVLKPLDEASIAKYPIRPAKKRNIALGGVLGLVLGAGMAILADYLTVPLDTIIAPQLVDTATGAYNKEHFMQRLREEMARARRQDYFLSVAVFDLDHAGGLKGVRSPEARAELLRKATVFLQQYLREEDLLAHFGDALFALLLPDVSQDVAKKLATRLQTRMAWAPFELERAGVRVNLACGVGVASLAEETTDPDELVESARKNLQRAGAPNYGVTDQFEEDLIVEDLRLQEQ